METDTLVHTTTTDGSDLRYMTSGRATEPVATDREPMETTSNENPFQNPSTNDRSIGIHFECCITDAFGYVKGMSKQVV